MLLLLVTARLTCASQGTAAPMQWVSALLALCLQRGEAGPGRAPPGCLCHQRAGSRVGATSAASFSKQWMLSLDKMWYKSVCMLERDFLATLLCSACSSGSGACTYICEERVNKEWAAPNSNTLLLHCLTLDLGGSFLCACLTQIPNGFAYTANYLLVWARLRLMPGLQGGSMTLRPEREQAGQRGKAMQMGPFWEELSSSPFLWAHSDSRNNTEQIPSCQAGVDLLSLKSMLSDTDKDTVWASAQRRLWTSEQAATRSPLGRLHHEGSTKSPKQIMC